MQLHSRTAANVAWTAAATHIVASFTLLLFLRGGLPGFSDAERIDYIRTHLTAWTLGWMSWQIAAISLLALYAVLAIRFAQRSPVLCIAALLVAAAGFSIDFASESRYIGVLSELSGTEFARLDRELEVLIGYAANGLYTIALLFLVIAGWSEVPRLTNWLGLVVVVAGLVLAGASLAHAPRVELLSSAALFPLLTLWIVLVARWLRRVA